MWEYIGLELEIDDGELKQIKANNAGNTKDCLLEMLRVWLKQTNPPPSWSAIADAIEQQGSSAIATKLRSRYTVHPQFEISILADIIDTSFCRGESIHS